MNGSTVLYVDKLPVSVLYMSINYRIKKALDATNNILKTLGIRRLAVLWR